MEPAAALGEAMAYIELHRLQPLVSSALEAAVVSRSSDPVAFIVHWLRKKRRAPPASVDEGVQRHIADPHAPSIAGLYTVDPDSGVFTLDYAEEGASLTPRKPECTSMSVCHAHDAPGVPYGGVPYGTARTLTASCTVQLPLPLTCERRVQLELRPLARA